MSLPTISVVGNLKRIETKFTQSGKQVTSFTVECAEKNAKGEYQNLYLKGECWDKQAEFVNQYFRDGSVAIVTGKLYTNVYEKQDGTKAYETKLLFPSVSFAPKEKSDNQPQQQDYRGHSGSNQPNPTYGEQQYPQNYNQHTAYREQPKQMPDRSCLPEIDIDDSQIPF